MPSRHGTACANKSALRRRCASVSAQIPDAPCALLLRSLQDERAVSDQGVGVLKRRDCLALAVAAFLVGCGNSGRAGTASDAGVEQASDARSDVANAGDDGPLCTPPAELMPIADSGSSCVYDVAGAFAGDSGHVPTHVDIRLPNCPGGPVDVPLRASLASCTSVAGAVFEPPGSPIQLELCPGTCTRALGACGGKVEVVFGCGIRP